MCIKKIKLNMSVYAIAAVACLMLSTAPYFASAQNGGSDAMVGDFLKIYNFTANKVTQLADAMPADKYSWRPAEGVRSVQESMMHVASANYFFGSQLGGAIPDGVNPQELENKQMSKEETIKVLDESVNFFQTALKNMDTKQMDAKVKLMGNEYSKRQVIFIAGDHVAEHLGQLIAYARSNGVTPPWSPGQ